MATPALASLAEAAKDLAYTDDLTGLFNQRLLKALFEHLWPGLLAGCDRLAVMMIDLDRFKEVNDVYGHLTGDAVLRATAAVLSKQFRSDDVIVRYGGDEFVIVLPGAGKTEAGKLGERARTALSTLRLTAAESDTPVEVPVSFSIGVASYPEDGSSGEELLLQADRLLLDDKRERHGDATAPGPTRPIRTRTVVLVGGLVVAIALAVVSFLAPRLYRGDSGREAVLQAQIATLQRALAALNERATRSPDATAQEGYRKEVGALTGRIRELEGQLGQAAPAAGQEGTVATPAPLPSPQPALGPTPAEPGGNPEAEATPAAATQNPATGPTDMGQARSLFVPPVLVRYDQPPYPPIARRFGRETSVELRVVVDATGRVTKAVPVGPPALFGFDQAAREAALRAIFRPATRDGVPIEMETALVIRFRLEQQR